MVFGFATWQICALVSTFLLTFLPQGSVTWVNYAYRIQHLPAGLFGAAIGSVAIAEYSHQVASSSIESVRGRFRHAMSLVSVLTVPAALLLIALAFPVTQLIYQHGRFTAMDTSLTAQALALYCLGIWAAAATRNVAAGFYSTGDTRTPALIALCVVLGNIAINLVLMRFIGFLSFPLAASFTQFANFAGLFLILRRRTGGLEGRHILNLTLRTLVAALLAGLLAFGVSWIWGNLVPSPGIIGQLRQVAIAGLAGIAAYYGLCRLLRIDETRDAFRNLAGLLSRGRRQP
jgi:putative peptidoglycan lipid II flippase